MTDKSSISSNISASAFEDWRHYRDVKTAKLQQQYGTPASNCTSKVFEGTVAFISPSVTHIRTNEETGFEERFDQKDLLRLYAQHGGTISMSLDASVTHYIGDSIPISLKRQLHESSRTVVRVQLLSAEWVFASIQRAARAPVLAYSLTRPKGMATSAENPNFVADYLKSSRLHKLSTWKAELTESLTRDVPPLSPDKHVIDKSGTRIYAYIDMDAFFATVSLRNRPDLRDKPVAITHGGQRGVCASVNYKARQYGVENGSWLGDAEKKCPALVTLPYDFEAYESVARQVLNLVRSRVSRVKVLSCDECLVDISHTAGIDQAEQLIGEIRQSVFDSTQCTCSAGIGTSPLLALFALRQAKLQGPNHQFTAPLNAEQLGEWLKALPCDWLPRIGRTNRVKLESLRARSLRDVQHVSLEELRRVFGVNEGLRLYEACRGIDRTQNAFENEPKKSVTLSVTYGVRFTEQQEVQFRAFLRDMVREVCQRLTRANMRARALGMVIYRRDDSPGQIDEESEGSQSADSAEDDARQKEVAPRTAQPRVTSSYLGHGRCTQVKAAKQLRVASSDAEQLLQEWLTLWRETQVSLSDLRGVVLKAHKLENNKHGQSPTSPRTRSIAEYFKPQSPIKVPPEPAREPIFAEESSEQVIAVFREWFEQRAELLLIDVELIQQYLQQLIVLDHNLDAVVTLLNLIKRKSRGKPGWQTHVTALVTHVQTTVQRQYQSQLVLAD